MYVCMYKYKYKYKYIYIYVYIEMEFCDNIPKNLVSKA